MARSLKSKRRKQNKRELRKRYKPRYDAQLKAIVENFKEETHEVTENSNDEEIIGYKVKTLKPPNIEFPVTKVEDTENQMDDIETVETENAETKKAKIPRVDIKKVARFMSQRKYRTYNAKVKRDKKRITHQKPGQKKKRIIKW